MASRAPLKELDSVVIRFAGDSGDGMQTVGEQFTDSSALAGNDIRTLPDFPAEIRAPAGSLPGVSGFQIQFGASQVLTPGDAPDALVAMNPAALKTNLSDLVPNGVLVVNTAAFTDANLKLAGYEANPLEDRKLDETYEVIRIDLNQLTLDALAENEMSQRDKLRCRNFFALGFMYFVYGRPLDATIDFVTKKWGKRKPEVAEANIRVLKAGYYFGETTETSRNRYQVAKAVVKPGVYRKISGNEALVLGLIVGARKAQRELLFSGYPITPASSILEGLSAYKHLGVRTVQAEDEIAAAGVALGASYAGNIGVTATSGPGICLKGEFLGLAVSVELPLIIIDVQRGGPSTGLPTKTEQADLLMALYGRHGESPMPIVAASSPSDCFETAIEAMRIALVYGTPVMVLSDLYIANGSEPWEVPDLDSIEGIEKAFAKENEDYVVFRRDSETLARTQAIPGQPGLEHRIGGLEKNEKGGVSYDPENHEQMCRLRAAKVARVAKSIPALDVNGAEKGKLLVLGWGGTYGSITAAVNQLRAEGFEDVSSAHLRHLHPFPANLGEVLAGFDRVLVPELNLGQLSFILRSEYGSKIESFNKMQGKPFQVAEMKNRILESLRR
jgi:2-oxoglutarate ferredoxin oxidoreductase subunit alpha